jgi:signal transduction histidine kinase/PAS domain-containing protein
MKPWPKIKLQESCKNLYGKTRAHFSDYWLFYLLSSIGWILGIFYFLESYRGHDFISWEYLKIFGYKIAFLDLINSFWIALSVATLILSSFFYCKGRLALKNRIQLEKELQKRQIEEDRISEFYEKIIENVPVSIVTLDKEGSVVSVNPYFYVLAEKPPTGRTGKKIFDFSFVKKSDELRNKYLNLLDSGVAFRHYNCHYQASLEKPPKYIDIYAVPLKDRNGKIEGAISIAQDNTEAFYALEAVRNQARQLYLINQVSRAINSVLNLSEVLWLILRNAVKLTNAVSGAILLLENQDKLAVKEAYNMPPGWQNLNIKIGQGLSGHAAFIKQPYCSNDVRNDSYYIGGPEMESVKSELAVPILLEKNVIGVIKIDSDELGRFKDTDIELMTTLANNAAIAIVNSQLYEEVKNLNKTLEEKVKLRTEELENANQKLAKAVELKSQFIADASHELRTPLTIIKGNLDLALWDKEISAKDLCETLKIIDEEVGHMSGILADLMILTHAGAGKLNLKKATASLDNILKTAAQSMEVLAKEKNIRIEVVDNGKINAIIDENKFLKMILNLVSNAVKYGKENGWVKLKAETDQKEIRVSISDNGIGIPKEEAPFIFERFYRVDKVRTRELIGGSGLGLAICKSIAEAHGGYIDVQSELGVGSQFTVHLPNKKIDFIEG